MNENPLIETLRELGLSEHESAVYFAALSSGPTTILNLARASGIKRTTIYSIVESLKQKGLMNIEVSGFKKKFVAESPEKLEVMLETRRKKFHSLLPEFSALYNLKGGESFLKYYEGLEAIKGVYESLIRDIKPHEDYLIFSNMDHWITHDEKYFTDFLYRRAKLPINIRSIFQDTPTGRKYKSLEKNINAKVKLLPEETKLSTNLVVTPERVLIHQLTHPIIGIVIENKSVIQMHREMFEVMWRALPE